MDFNFEYVEDGMALTYNGKPFKAGDFEKDLKRQMKEAVANEIRERIGSIRDPKTGEFPVVVVRGRQLDDLRVSIEGSKELIALIHDKLPLEEAGMIDFTKVERPSSPTAFLSYASEDHDLAEHVATALQGAGIETWWDRWEIGAGDSIVQKVNEGLGECSHFIVLLTPTSIEKPWVQTEMDTGFVRKVSGEAKFIALRSDLPAERLPALLRPLHSPELTRNTENGLEQLISDIFEFNKKPILGKKPEIADQPPSPYSNAAMAVAEYFCGATKNATWGYPQISEEDLAKAVGLSLEDTRDALYELRDYFREDHFVVMADNNLWAEFDKFFINGADPAGDAFQIAADMMNDPEFPTKPSEIAEKYGWAARRLNPAVSFLIERELVTECKHIGMGPWVTGKIEKSDATRRYVKSRS